MISQPEWITPFMREAKAIFLITTMLSIAAGTTFLMWLGEKITEKGVGNGISLLIAVGIMAHYPPSIKASIQNIKLEAVPAIWGLIVIFLCIVTTLAIILIQEGARKIPIQHAKQAVGRKVQVGQTNYLPLKVNTAGVMPVIFSTAILTLPPTLFGWLGSTGGQMGFLGEFFAHSSSYNLYNAFGIKKESIFLLLKAANMYTLLYVLLTGFFCFFYTAMVFNPADVADNLRRVGAFVPGYRPGKPTADYIDRVMSRITVVGALFLITVSIIPQLLMVAFNLPFQMAEFAGGTGLIIVVAVVLDTMKQIESRMLMKHYDGFKSRRSMTGARKWAERQA
jgi:preprotein translocase subunit SecY